MQEKAISIYQGNGETEKTTEVPADLITQTDLTSPTCKCPPSHAASAALLTAQSSSKVHAGAKTPQSMLNAIRLEIINTEV